MSRFGMAAAEAVLFTLLTIIFQNCAQPNSIATQDLRATSPAPPTVLMNKWSLFPSTAFAPISRYNHSAVWTGTKMIVFGGYNFNGTAALIQDNGKSYDRVSNIWVDINVTGGPGPRADASAVWIGSKMILWGGRTDAGTAVVNTGMAYDPATNLWSPISTTGAPIARYGHGAVWTGTKMIVWGGYSGTAT